MSGFITVEGLKPYDGRYEFDPDAEFTTREWGWIKRLTGYMPLTVEEGFAGGDPELIAILTVISIHRGGRVGREDVPGLYERLIDHAIEKVIDLKLDATGSDADDPPVPRLGASTSTSGDAGKTSSESSEWPTQHGSGTPGSDTSQSHPMRSAS